MVEAGGVEPPSEKAPGLEDYMRSQFEKTSQPATSK
jgi:hypothetical protein